MTTQRLQGTLRRTHSDFEQKANEIKTEPPTKSRRDDSAMIEAHPCFFIVGSYEGKPFTPEHRAGGKTPLGVRKPNLHGGHRLQRGLWEYMIMSYTPCNQSTQARGQLYSGLNSLGRGPKLSTPSHLMRAVKNTKQVRAKNKLWQ